MSHLDAGIVVLALVVLSWLVYRGLEIFGAWLADTLHRRARCSHADRRATRRRRRAIANALGRGSDRWTEA
jgi:hypothetical protein